MHAGSACFEVADGLVGGASGDAGAVVAGDGQLGVGDVETAGQNGWEERRAGRPRGAYRSGVTDSGLPAGELRDLLDCIARTNGCSVLPPTGGAVAGRGHRLPNDLRELYELCGGAWLFRDGPYQWRVCRPGDLVPASPRLLTEHIAREVATEAPEDLTNGCYVIADGGGAATDLHVVVDLHPARAGRCYLVSWDTYGLVGEMPVVATSVPELLRWLLSADGGNPTLATSQGDAYDQA